MSKSRQVTLSALLQDPVYRQWFQKQPTERLNTRWRVYVKVKKKGPWQKKDFDNWADAYRFVVKHHKTWYDCVLNCRNDPYRRPIVKVDGKRRYHEFDVSDDHRWCPHCRRPTLFGWFERHHAFGNLPPLPWRRRCSICGIAEEAIAKKY